MLNVFRFLVAALAAASLSASAQDPGPAQQEFAPKSGSGRVVVLKATTRKDQLAGEDAMQRTIARLKEALPAEGAK